MKSERRSENYKPREKPTRSYTTSGDLTRHRANAPPPEPVGSWPGCGPNVPTAAPQRQAIQTVRRGRNLCLQAGFVRTCRAARS